MLYFYTIYSNCIKELTQISSQDNEFIVNMINEAERRCVNAFEILSSKENKLVDDLFAVRSK